MRLLKQPFRAAGVEEREKGRGGGEVVRFGGGGGRDDISWIDNFLYW